MSDYLSEFGSFLKRPLGNNLDNDQNDVLQARKRLKKAGYEAGEQDRPYMDAPLEKAIRSFQKDKGLYVDGYMEPGGETEQAFIKSNAAPVPQAEPKWKGPEIKGDKDRYESIINDTPGKFNVQHSSKANYNDPKVSIKYFGKEAIDAHKKEIEEFSEKYELDPDIAKSVIYAENMRGYYGRAADPINMSTSYFPGNIDREKWKKLPKEDIKTDRGNIEASVILLKRIQERIPSATPEQITAVWHALEAEHVDDLGEHVGRLYKEKPWNK